MDSLFFADNRKALMEGCSNGALVMSGHTALQLSADMATPFCQESNFWYLTGIEEPDWQLIMTPAENWLVAPDISEVHRVFDGGLSNEQAVNISGVKNIITQSEAQNLRIRLAEEYGTAYSLGNHPHQKYFNFTVNPAGGKLWRQLKKQFSEVKDIRRDLSRLRATKQPAEIAAIKKAINVTVNAFERAYQKFDSYQYEYQIDADFTYAFRNINATHAYDPIVAGGINACTLHYSQNAAKLERSSLVLLDIGAKDDGYSADITRTYAISRPTDRQKSVHAVVLGAHREIIALLEPGLTFEKYQEEVDRIMKRALKHLGLLKADKDYRRYFPHAVSHGLGVDVHDSLGGFDKFEEGMILTVEPGIYIPEEGIGVRLEDDILITGSGHENLSEALSLEL